MTGCHMLRGGCGKGGGRRGRRRSVRSIGIGCRDLDLRMMMVRRRLVWRKKHLSRGMMSLLYRGREWGQSRDILFG